MPILQLRRPILQLNPKPAPTYTGTYYPPQIVLYFLKNIINAPLSS